MLTYQTGGRFVLYAKTADLHHRAQAAALELSIPATHRRGMPVYMSGNPYGVLEFLPAADEGARQALAPLAEQYRASWAVDTMRRFPSPPGYEPMPFQSAGIAYALDVFSKAGKGVLIGDEPGLGKTVEAIVLANEMQAKRVIAVVPGGTRKQWERMVRAWSTLRPLYTRVYEKAPGHRVVQPGVNWIILSFELLNNPTILAQLMQAEFDLLVIDEAHKLKTSSSQRSRNVLGWIDEDGPRGLISRCEYAAALTGTPLPNRPRECYTLGRRFAWEAFDFLSEAGFQQTFNPSKMVHLTDKETGEQKRFVDERHGRLLELQARLRCNFMVRRLEKQPGMQMQLPKERYELAYVEPDGAIRRVLKAEEPLHIRISDFEDIKGLTIEEQGHIATLRRLMGEAKVPRLVEMINDRLDGGLDKLLVFCFHRVVITTLADKLSSHGAVTLLGGMSLSRQEAAKERFINDPDCHLGIMQINMAGVGLDGMQVVCSHVLFGEASWVAGDNDQALRRLKRYGQARSVLAEFAVAPGSLDEKIIGGSLKKLAVTTQALDCEVI